MTVHRRGGRPNGGVGRRKQQQTKQQQRRRSQSSSDENSSDGGSVTRCICGETHNLGLMVQCDKCEVWQHCICIGLEQQSDIPDQYYCEQCKPENHKSTRLTNGRTKRHYNASGRTLSAATAGPPKTAPKKRMTLNSREASMSLEDVLAARTALEMYEHNVNDEETTTHSPTELHEEGHQEEAQLPNNHENETVKEDNEVIVKPTNKRKRELEIKLPDTIDEKSEPPSSTVSSVGHDELPIIKEQDESPEPVVTTPKPKPKRKPRQQQPKQPPSPSDNNSISSSLIPHGTERALPEKRRYNNGNGRANGRQANKRGKPRSRTSTPQPMRDDSSPQQQTDDEGTPNEDSIATMLFEYFSPRARASSPPAKTRHPSSRMSISEMNKRANQILEYISSIQVEMATTNSSPMNHAGNDTTAKRMDVDDDDNDDNDDNDSLSSASTIPLQRDNRHDFVEDEDEDEMIDREKQTSMDIMDMLTRKLIKFQRKFGSRNRALYEEAMMEGEGRVTRSREASGNANVFRNMMAH